MKLVYRFESEDFQSGGQMIVRQSLRVGADGGAIASVAYKIGYLKVTGEANPVMMVSLTDGMCRKFDNLGDLCTHLNNDPFGYRPMTTDEIVAAVTYTGNRFVSQPSPTP